MTKVLTEYGDKFSLPRKQFSLTPKTQRNAHILKSGVTMCLFLRSGAIRAGPIINSRFRYSNG